MLSRRHVGGRHAEAAANTRLKWTGRKSRRHRKISPPGRTLAGSRSAARARRGAAPAHKRPRRRTARTAGRGWSGTRAGRRQGIGAHVIAHEARLDEAPRPQQQEHRAHGSDACLQRIGRRRQSGAVKGDGGFRHMPRRRLPHRGRRLIKERRWSASMPPIISPSAPGA